MDLDEGRGGREEGRQGCYKQLPARLRAGRIVNMKGEKRERGKNIMVGASDGARLLTAVQWI